MYKYVIRMADVPLICASISCKVVRLLSVSQGTGARPEVEVSWSRGWSVIRATESITSPLQLLREELTLNS